MKYLITLLAVVLLTITAQAQEKTKINVDELVVTDSSGMVYTKALWQKLVFTGKFSLRMSNDRKSATLVKVSDEEALRRMMSMPKPRESNFFRTGDKFTSFNEKDINGTRFNLKELTGKVVVLNFWFINCAPCRQEMPELNEVVEAFKSNPDVVFISLALDEKYEIKEFLKTTPFAYKIIDNARFLAQKYGVNSYPTHVVLDRQGKVLFHTTGLAMNTVSWVEKSIKEALQAPAVQ